MKQMFCVGLYERAPVKFSNLTMPLAPVETKIRIVIRLASDLFWVVGFGGTIGYDRALCAQALESIPHIGRDNHELAITFV